MRAFHVAMAAGVGLAAISLSPAIAEAANGFTTSPTAQRAGPGIRYPVVAMIPGGASINIYGCVANANWCDVSWRGNRGWVNGGNIQVAWRGKRNPIISFYRQLGIPIITFGFDDYWNHYYRGKPFYKQRNDFGPGPKKPFDKDMHRFDKDKKNNNQSMGDKKPPFMQNKGPQGGPKGGDRGCKPGDNNGPDGKNCRPDH